MKTLHLSLIILAVIIFLGFGLEPAHADDANSVSIQNIKVQPSTIKVGDTFTVTATLVNNSTVPIVLDGGTCVPIIEHVPFFIVMFDNHAKIKAENMTCAGVGLSKILNSGKTIIGTSPDSTIAYIATKSGTANVTVTFSYHVTNQTDPTQPNIEQTISKSLLFTISDNNTGSKTVSETVLSPLKQIKSGITANDVKCQQDLQLVIKSEDGSPACVTSYTAIALAAHGWAINPKSTIMHVELDQSHYPPNNLDYYFMKGMIYTASGPVQNSTVSILGNNIPIGNVMTDQTGCFEFDSWNNTEINQEISNANSNHQESYTLKITAAYLGDGIHNAVNDTKNAVVYFEVFPIPPPFYESSTNPPTVQVKQGESTSLELFVKYLTAGPVGPMDMTIQRLPCGVTYTIPSSNGTITSGNDTTTSGNSTFNISIKTQDYTHVGKYYLDVIQDTSHFENPNIIPNPYIGMINLEVLPK